MQPDIEINLLLAVKVSRGKKLDFFPHVRIIISNALTAIYSDGVSSSLIIMRNISFPVCREFALAFQNLSELTLLIC